MKANLGVDMAKVAGFVLTQGPTASGTSALTGGVPLHVEGTGDADPTSQLYTLNKDGTLTIVTVTQGGSSDTDVTPFAVFE
jgi:hypothetical protein